MLRIILIVLVAIVVGSVALFFYIMPPVNLSAYQNLKSPQISDKPNQKMLVVTATGDPNVVGVEAFELLITTYFNTPGTPKRLAAPRARWPVDFSTPPAEWTGLYALPVPESVTALPADLEVPAGMEIEITTWEYGEVAEVLHFGSYESETSTIEMLMGFIASQGYEVAGPHEEEYLKGPGTPFVSSEDDYVTIIRYQVRKIGAE